MTNDTKFPSFKWMNRNKQYVLERKTAHRNIFKYTRLNTKCVTLMYVHAYGSKNLCIRIVLDKNT